ncbi:MAG: orotidine-5'-phosphate decarboxylase [Epsilonproteobacteria bacterium]|nr:orotidine-5'-phosphate decarboxylase [Campylobacterota bacterium]
MKLCIALDNPSKEQNLQLAKDLSHINDEIWLKVGFRSYIRDGNAFVEELKKLGFKVFLDLKLYDIPNTMATAAVEIANLGVDMFNIHASASRVAMYEVMNKLANLQTRPLVLAVTVLTSFDEANFEEIYEAPIAQKAEQFAKMSYENGLDGVVCSAFESLDIKEITSDNFITLTPGIRPFNESSSDQKRVADIEFAYKAKSDFIVIGRPIYQSPNPLETTQKILTQIKQLKGAE